MFDRPALSNDEIEITPEMIEAGVEILFDYDAAFSNEKDIVAKIFRTMLSVFDRRCRERL
jgi:hypothetical protein